MWSWPRVTSVSKHHWRPIKGSPLKPLGLSQCYRIEGLKGALNWAPIIVTVETTFFVLLWVYIYLCMYK